MMHLPIFLLLLIGEVWSETVKEASATNHMLYADDNKIKSHQSDEILIIIESFRAMQKQMDVLRRTIENEMQRFNKTIEHQMNSLHRKLEDSDRKIEEVHHNLAINTKLIRTLSDTCSKEHITTEYPTTTPPTTPPRAAPLILVENGWSNNPGFCQLVDLSSNRICKTIARYPLKVWKAAGSIIDDQPLICGGYNLAAARATDECYIYMPNIDSWKLFARLPERRRNMAAVKINSTLWLLGGYSNAYGDYKSTLFVDRDGIVEHGPDLPTAKGGFCVVDLKDGRYMMIGGDTNYGRLKEVHIYYPRNGSFIMAPSLSMGRSFHACALFNSPLHEYRPTILVAGDSIGKGMMEMEMLDFTNPSAVWEQHGSIGLPSGYAFYNAEAVSTGNNVYLRLKGSFYQLVWSTRAFSWRKIKGEMDNISDYSLTMVLPNKYSCQD